jgi:hypothetical protein
MRYEQCKCGCDRSINKRTLLETKIPIRLYLDFNWTGFPGTPQIAFPTLAAQAVSVWFRLISN